MIITLYGPDTYRRKQKLDEIVRSYIEKKANLAYEVVDAEEEGALLRAVVFWETPSLFQDTKLLVVKHALDIAEQSRLKKFLKIAATSKQSTLVLSEDTKLIRKEFYFLKEKPNQAQEFALLEGPEFFLFVGNEANKRNLKIESSALKILTEAFAGDSWGVVQELDKLTLLRVPQISLDLLKNCDIHREGDFFSYISDWFRKSAPERLQNLEQLFVAKNDPAKIFNVLAYQDKTQLRRFADYDVEIKSGRLEYEEALLELAII